MNLPLYPKTVLKFLIAIISILLLLNIASFIYWDTDARELFNLFNFDRESNIPTFFSVLILFISFLLLLFIALVHKKRKSDYVLWLILCIIFLFLSFDEFVQIHERIGGRIQRYFNLSGFFYYAWVIPYGIFLISFTFFYYFKFLPQFSKRIFWLFIISGSIFAGVIGFEMLAAKNYDSANFSEILNVIYYSIEELLEMLGIALFIYTLLIYIGEEFQITVESKKNSFNN